MRGRRGLRVLTVRYRTTFRDGVHWGVIYVLVNRPREVSHSKTDRPRDHEEVRSE